MVIAPTSRGESLRGLDTSGVRLGAALPGTQVTIYDDALAKMRDELSYLHATDTRYWYDTRPTLEKMARDRASRQDMAAIPGSDAVSKRAYERAKADELVAEVYTPFLLQRDLDSLLLAGRDSIAASELWDDFCRYCYLRRLRDSDVLAEAIAQGATSRDYFGYADGQDGDGRFLGLRMGARPVVDLHSGLVVARDAALAQLAFDSEREQQKPGAGVPGTSTEPGDTQPSSGPGAEPGGNPSGEPATPPEPPKPVMHDVELEATLDQWSAGSDVGTIAEEILQRLYDLRGSSAHLTLSAEVSVPGGIDDTTLRIIKENAGSLGVTLRVR